MCCFDSQPSLETKTEASLPQARPNLASLMPKSQMNPTCLSFKAQSLPSNVPKPFCSGSLTLQGPPSGSHSAQSHFGSESEPSTHSSKFQPPNVIHNCSHLSPAPCQGSCLSMNRIGISRSLQQQRRYCSGSSCNQRLPRHWPGSLICNRIIVRTKVV